MTTNYVVGFAFDQSRERVALIRKKRPSWQRGCLNGIGGHVEPGEQDADAMTREFWEETGVMTTPGVWELFCILSGKGVRVAFFRATLPSLAQLKSTTDEVIKIVSAREPGRVIRNLRWLIPLALSGEKLACEYSLH